jgi:hypothetical protein
MSSHSPPATGRPPIFVAALAGAKRALREGHYLTGDRLRAYTRLFGAAMLLLMLAAAIDLVVDALGPHGRVRSSDFVVFWSSARLAVSGHAAQAYDAAAMYAAEWQGAVVKGDYYKQFWYPPVFLLLCLPLGLLPYFAAMAAFASAGYITTVACLARLLPRRFPRLPLLAFPGLVISTINVQNGGLSAACFAGAALLIGRRPGLAGACLGVLAYKPHLAIGVPVALLATRNWRAIIGAGASAGGLVALSLLAFGPAPWIAFLHMHASGGATFGGSHDVWKILSLFAILRDWGFGAPAAYAAQGLAALLALSVLAVICARTTSPQIVMAALVPASFAASPYLLDYDLACLGVPLAVLTAGAMRGQWRAWEKSILLAAYLLPLLPRWLNGVIDLPLTPGILGLLLLVIWRRALEEKEESSFSEEKEAKRLLFLRGFAGLRSDAPRRSLYMKEFWFFSSKEDNPS